VDSCFSGAGNLKDILKNTLKFCLTFKRTQCEMEEKEDEVNLSLSTHLWLRGDMCVHVY